MLVLISYSVNRTDNDCGATTKSFDHLHITELIYCLILDSLYYVVDHYLPLDDTIALHFFDMPLNDKMALR